MNKKVTKNIGILAGILAALFIITEIASQIVGINISIIPKRCVMCDEYIFVYEKYYGSPCCKSCYEDINQTIDDLNAIAEKYS